MNTWLKKIKCKTKIKTTLQNTNYDENIVCRGLQQTDDLERYLYMISANEILIKILRYFYIVVKFTNDNVFAFKTIFICSRFTLWWSSTCSVFPFRWSIPPLFFVIRQIRSDQERWWQSSVRSYLCGDEFNSISLRRFQLL